MTAEQQLTSSTPAAIRVNVLRRNAPEQQLSFVQSVTLEEPAATIRIASFASAADENVFCAIRGSTYVHEICRSPGAAAAVPFVGSKAHRLPAVVFGICGYQFAGEQRLVASFDDRTVRVFRTTNGGLSEIQRISAPTPDCKPRRLLGLSNNEICVSSVFVDAQVHRKCLGSTSTLSTRGAYCRKT